MRWRYNNNIKGCLVLLTIIIIISPSFPSSKGEFNNFNIPQMKLSKNSNNSLADNVDIKPYINPVWLQLMLTFIPDVPAFEIQIYNGNDVQIYYKYNVTVEWNNGVNIFELDPCYMSTMPLGPGWTVTIGLPCYKWHFISMGHLAGRFSVHAEVTITDDQSIKTETFEGFIFFPFVWVW